MAEAVEVQTDAREHLRIARLLDGHGDIVGAICAYREVIRDGTEPAATDARLRIASLACRD